MKCRMSRYLAEYQIGALPEPKRARIEQHLAKCVFCQRELKALHKTAALLEPMPLHEAPAFMWHRISPQLTPRQRSRTARQWIPALAAAWLVLVIILFALWSPWAQPVYDNATADSLLEIHVAAAWHEPLTDKAALGLVLLAAEATEAPPGERAIN